MTALLAGLAYVAPLLAFALLAAGLLALLWPSRERRDARRRNHARRIR